ncbi:hypothetical protein [Heyndrickxia acidicola]|uniref:Uncharacterized protein n=1 Tax=Heyndrickxia acidicola TaxID=209389 RepID=A0ABU6MCZ9_9BACI|nr:hypothetical protein [Heyndrickxia acidicola]MED1202540.1 hypothetical protein [Heyndrickxia acidicola]
MKNFNDKIPVYPPQAQMVPPPNTFQMNGKKIKKGGCGCNKTKKIK